MLLSLKASGHHGHSVALGLKVSHIQSIQCSIEVLSLSWYPNKLLSISKCYYPERALQAFCSFRVESQSLTKYKSKNIGGHHAYFVALGFKGNHSLSMKGMKHVINSVYNNFIMS